MTREKEDKPNEVINIERKLKLLDETWSPRVVAAMNEYYFKVVRIDGEFIWHSHPDTDETFLVISGEMDIELRDRTVHLSRGEMFVVPRGVEHRPVAAAPCELMLIEPAGTPNTGDAGGDRSVDENQWI